MHNSTSEDPYSGRDSFVKEITKDHHEKLLLYALGLCHQYRLHHLAGQDILQKMYLELLEKWPASEMGYREKGIGFLCRIIKFDTNDSLRKQKSIKRREEVFSKSIPEKVDLHYLCVDLHTNEFYEHLEKALKQEDYLLMKDYLEGHTYQELAQLYNHPINTIGTKIRRAKLLIRKALKDD